MKARLTRVVLTAALAFFAASGARVVSVSLQVAWSTVRRTVAEVSSMARGTSARSTSVRAIASGASESKGPLPQAR